MSKIFDPVEWERTTLRIHRIIDTGEDLERLPVIISDRITKPLEKYISGFSKEMKKGNFFGVKRAMALLVAASRLAKEAGAEDLKAAAQDMFFCWLEFTAEAGDHTYRRVKPFVDGPKKLRTRNGMAPDERETRNNRIREDFKKSKLRHDPFASHHAKNKTYEKGDGKHLSKSGIKKVIKPLSK